MKLGIGIERPIFQQAEGDGSPKSRSGLYPLQKGLSKWQQPRASSSKAACFQAGRGPVEANNAAGLVLGAVFGEDAAELRGRGVSQAHTTLVSQELGCLALL